MNVRSFAFALLALPLAALAACSSASSDGGPGGGTASIPAAFSKYCSGKLATEQKIMHPMSGGGWMGTGDKIGAGTPILLEADFSHWSAYAIMADGSPVKIDADFEKGLVLGTDFTSDCAPAKVPSFGDANVKNVTLAKATIYPNADLTGTACTLDAGTQFTNYSMSGGGSSSELSADELKAKCSMDKGYSKDLYTAELITLAAPK